MLLGSKATSFQIRRWPGRDGVRGRGRAACVFAFAELAQVNAAQQLVGVNVVGRGLSKPRAVVFGLLHPANGGVEIGERRQLPR